MPKHPKLGAYEVFEDTFNSSVADPKTGDYVSVENAMTSYEFEEAGTAFDLYPVIYATNAKATEADIDAFADFVENIKHHTTEALTALTGPRWPVVLDMINDLVLSNPGMNVLGEMFPGEKLSNPDQVTPDMFGKHVSPANVMASKSELEPFRITLDMIFSNGGIDQLFACRFSPEGQFIGLDIES